MNNENSNKTMLSTDYQDQYWGDIRPDIRPFLDDFESREVWTYKYEDIPTIFSDIAETIPRITLMSISNETSAEVKKIVHQLILILASFPMRQAIFCISWLDKAIASDTDIGWGVTIYMEAAQVAKYKIDHPEYSKYKLMYDRINIVLNSQLSSVMFVQLQPLGEKK